MKPQVNCQQCRHFYITYEVAMPYGCRAWKIKTRQHPHVVVFTSSGMRCQMFEPKGDVGRNP